MTFLTPEIENKLRVIVDSILSEGIKKVFPEIDDNTFGEIKSSIESLVFQHCQHDEVLDQQLYYKLHQKALTVFSNYCNKLKYSEELFKIKSNELNVFVDAAFDAVDTFDPEALLH